MTNTKDAQLSEALLGLRPSNTQRIEENPFGDENLNFDNTNSKDELFKRYITQVGDQNGLA